MIRSLFLAAVALLPAAVAEAQVSSLPVHLPPATRHSYTGVSPVAELTRLKKANDWQALQDYGMKLLRELAGNPTIGPQLGSVERNYFYLVWVSTEADGKDVLHRVLFREGLTEERAAKLPGLKSAPAEQKPPDEGEVRDVLLSDATSATLDSVWVFTPSVNPIAAQLPDVVAKINPFAMIGRSLGTENQANSLLVYVNKPILRYRHGQILIKDQVTTLQSIGTLQTKAARTHASVLLRQARGSQCAQMLAGAMKKAIDDTASTAACAATGEACAKAIDTELKGTFARITQTDPARSACNAQPGGPQDPATATEQEFLKLAAEAGPKTVRGELIVKNAPLTRVSFGVMTGLLATKVSRDEPRVKVDGGKLVEAPLERLMTMVVVNYHPVGYDAEWPEVTMAERFRWFGGAVLTPDFGLTAGAGMGIVRGLSINGGMVWLFSDTLKSGETLGASPVDKNDPFELRGGSAVFFGLSYAFK